MARTIDSPDVYRHRTPDLWEGAFLWAMGYSANQTEISDDGNVTFIWPAMDPEIVDLAKSYRRGSAQVNAPAMRQGYYYMRNLLEGAQHASRT
jgi:hypothetical protein